MKRWIKRTLFALLGVGVLAGGLAACGHALHPQGFASMSAEDVARFRARALDKATRELQLDDAQKQRLEALFDRLREQQLALAPPGSAPRDTLSQIVAGERFDRERALALLGEKTDAVRAKGPEVIAAAADFYDALRPEQQARLRELMQRRHRWHG